VRKHCIPSLEIVTMKVPTQPQMLVQTDPSVGAHCLMGFGNQSRKMCHAIEGRSEGHAQQCQYNVSGHRIAMGHQKPQRHLIRVGSGTRASVTFGLQDR
jgi:hypothetical protein